VPVHDERGEGLVGGEDAPDGVGDGRHRGLVETVLGVGGGETGGEQQCVAVAQRDVEVLAQAQQHRPRRAGAARLDEAEVAGGDTGGAGEGELAQAAAAAPLPQELPDRHVADGSAHR